MFLRRGQCRADGAAQVEVSAPAKLNLFLEILAKRPDGFHDIETVMSPVSLYDTLTLTDDCSGELMLENDLSVAVAPPKSAEQQLPHGSENIVVRALEALRRASGSERGARVRLVKRIPLAAGMAGGSTDAAAALAAANAAWNLNLPDAKRAETAAPPGSDTPFFFAVGPPLCRGRGERIEPLGPLAPLHFAVVAPPEGLSTAAVYRTCRAPANPCRAESLIAAWRSGRYAELGRLLHNRLQEAAEALSPWIERTARELHRWECLGHRMSGSGTSYFALCRSAVHARRVAAALSRRGLGRTMALATCPS